MYSLRKISKEHVENNFYLGEFYTVINIERSLEEFKKEFLNYYGQNDNDCVYGFIRSGSQVYPLSKGYQNYIVSENGNTYQNLTFK